MNIVVPRNLFNSVTVVQIPVMKLRGEWAGPAATAAASLDGGVDDDDGCPGPRAVSATAIPKSMIL